MKTLSALAKFKKYMNALLNYIKLLIGLPTTTPTKPSEGMGYNVERALEEINVIKAKSKSKKNVNKKTKKQ